MAVMSNFNSTPANRALAAALRANVPVLLWGPPGIGKTATIEAFGRSNDMHVETIVGSNREPSDFMGFPVEIDGLTQYSQLGWARRLADAPRGLLFLDELTTCSPSVQRVMLRILQERVVGELRLPDTVAMVAAANPPEIAVDGWDLAAPVANRLMHLDWAFDADAWFEGFASGFEFSQAPLISDLLNDGDERHTIRVRSSVLGFLQMRPDLRLTVPNDPSTAGRGWPSPRSWTNAASVLAELREGDDEARMLVLVGLVGEAAALEFIAWSVSADLYDPYEVMKNPAIVDWTSRPDRIFALMSSVVAVAQNNGGAKAWSAAMRVVVSCAKSGRPDLGYSGARALMQNQPEGAVVPEGAVDSFRDVFVKTGKWAA